MVTAPFRKSVAGSSEIHAISTALVMPDGVARCRAAILVVLCLLLVAAGQANANSETSRRVLDCTLTSTSLNQCNFVSYGIRVGVWAVPGVLLGLGFWFTFPLYCSAKYCCNCCGGRTRAPGFCCANRKYPARYTKFDIARSRLAAIISITVAIICCVWCFAQSFTLIDSVTASLRLVVDTPTSLAATVNKIEQQLIVTLFRASTNSYYPRNLFASTGARQSADDLVLRVKNIVSNATTVALPYVDIAGISLKSVFGAMGGVCFIALILPLFALRRFSAMFVVWLMMFLSLPTWVFHGVVSTVTVVVGDVCAEVDGVAAEQTTVASSLIGCTDDWFTSFRENFKDLETTESRGACRSMKELCYNNALDLNTNVLNGAMYDCTALSTVNCETLTDFVEVNSMAAGMVTMAALSSNASLQVAEYGLTCAPSSTAAGSNSTNSSALCSLMDCATRCTLPLRQGGGLSTTGRIALQILSSVIGAKTIVNVADSTAAEYASCDSMARSVVGPLSKPCASLIDAFNSLRNGTGLLGLSLTMIIITFAWGSKRFISMDQANVIIDEDQIVQQEEAAAAAAEGAKVERDGHEAQGGSADTVPLGSASLN